MRWFASKLFGGDTVVVSLGSQDVQSPSTTSKHVRVFRRVRGSQWWWRWWWWWYVRPWKATLNYWCTKTRGGLRKWTRLVLEWSGTVRVIEKIQHYISDWPGIKPNSTEKAEKMAAFATLFHLFFFPFFCGTNQTASSDILILLESQNGNLSPWRLIFSGVLPSPWWHGRAFERRVTHKAKRLIIAAGRHRCAVILQSSEMQSLLLLIIIQPSRPVAGDKLPTAGW